MSTMHDDRQKRIGRECGMRMWGREGGQAGPAEGRRHAGARCYRRGRARRSRDTNSRQATGRRWMGGERAGRTCRTADAPHHKLHASTSVREILMWRHSSRSVVSCDRFTGGRMPMDDTRARGDPASAQAKRGCRAGDLGSVVGWRGKERHCVEGAPFQGLTRAVQPRSARLH
jgi:hypothetical protein